MKKFWLCLLGVMCLESVVSAQSEGMYAQYMFNGLAINPAYAGSRGALSLTALSRFQGTGLEGAPRTQTFSADAALHHDRMGVGFIAINDKLGVTRQSGFFGSYSYAIPFNDGSRLSLGLQAGVNFKRASYSQLNIYQPGDPIFGEDMRETQLNIGTGAYYLRRNLYAGLSVPQLLGNDGSRIVQNNPMIFTAGMLFELSYAFKLKPNILMKLIEWRGVEYNINTNLLIHDVLWIGVSYRPNTSLNFLLEMLVTNQLRIGYSYEAGINELAVATNGSHEIMVNYHFRFTKRGAVDPRYF